MKELYKYLIKKIKIKLLYIIISAFIVSCNNRVEPDEEQRYPLLLNMVHHNPGEPEFVTQFTEPAFLKEKGYTGQVPKIEIQCGLTYDRLEDNVIPEKSDENYGLKDMPQR
jgi:hypothetical protein